MAKIAVKKEKTPSVKDKAPPGEKKKLQKKKKKIWKKAPEITGKPSQSKKASLLLPPKKPQEFSSNWKALQELLKSEKSNPSKESPTKPATKEVGIKNKEKHKSDPQSEKQPSKINGEVKEGPAAKKTTKNAAGDASSVHKANEKKRKRSLDEEEKHSETRKNKAAPITTTETPKVDLWFDDVDPDDIEAALGPEAGQIAREMQGLPEKKSDSLDTILVKDRAFEGLTRIVAMDCEMVGVGTDGEDSILARVSIVNQFGKCVYDKFVKPTERVTDYRTQVSGVRPQDIRNGEQFKVVQKEVSEILQGRILVGHALHNDLKILLLDHPKKAIRDTQKYKPFKQKVKSGRPSLKHLCEKILSVKVQTGEHCSIQDAQATMRLYTMEKKNWEAAIKAKYNKARPQKEKKASPQ